MPEPPAEPPRWSSLALRTGGLALAYVALGRLGILLAIPPGYATAIFPPAGLAFHQSLRQGPRALPGIWLGSYLLNLSIAWGGPLGTSWKVHLLSALIGIASALQAWIGGRIARAVAPDPLRLESPRELAAVLGVGGPLACLVAPTLASTVLLLGGLLSRAALPFAWWTWWVGDSLGVILLVPLIQILTVKSPLWRERRLTVALPLVLCVFAVVVIFVRVSRREEAQLHHDLRDRADRVGLEIANALQARRELLHAMGGLFRAMPALDPAAFRGFVDPYLQRYPDLHSVDWVPRVLDGDRSTFELRTARALGEGYTITDAGPELSAMPAARRSEYWPLTLKHPWEANRAAKGLDLRIRPFQGELMVKARNEASPRLVVLDRLMQDPEPRTALVLTMPVFAGPGIPPPEAREASLLGFVSVIFYADPLLRDASARAGHRDVALTLRALRSDGHALEAARIPLPPAGDWAETVPLEIFGAQMKVVARPTDQFLLTRQGWQVFLVLAGGLSFTGMLLALLLLISGQVSEARGLAADRGRALATVEARARVILDHAVEPILIFQASGQIEDANGAAQRMLGWDSSGLLAHPVSELVPGILTHLPTMGGTGSIREALAFPREGEPIPVEVGLNAVALEGRTMFAAFLRDLRDRQKVERLKNELIAVVSHELRTPLTSLRGTLGLLEGGVVGSLPERAQDLVRIAHQNARHLSTLVDDILDLEKLEAGKLRLDLKVQPLEPLLAQALELSGGFAAKLGVTLGLEVLHPAAQARVDGGRLIQVLNNLLSNAIKHSPSASEVRLTLLDLDAAWRLQVRDQGPGVPEGFQALLFEKFTQADATEGRKIPGTGLGLAISRSLVERMGGHIGFRNEPSGGAAFYVDFPKG
jgi:PAS domain S-box-containing protein